MSIRVLVVDDAPFIREVLCHLLVQNGFEVVGEAVDGEHAVELAAATEPQVVLMDLVMPKKTGVEATRQILAALPDTRVIACSTVDQQSMVMKALEAGCCDYVEKPFQSERLLSAIRGSLAKKSRAQGGM